MSEIVERIAKSYLETEILENCSNLMESLMGRKEVYEWIFSPVSEWWSVTRWLCNKLQEAGEIIIIHEDLNAWGRKASGQNILSDGILQKIVKIIHKNHGVENW